MAPSSCRVCERQMLDNGLCLYCTPTQALDLPEFLPDYLLASPAKTEALCLLDTASLRRTEMTRPRLRIGRAPSNHVVIEGASPIHAVITYEDGLFWLEDMGSRHGTRLNGSLILVRECLSPGDVVTVGDTDLLVE